MNEREQLSRAIALVGPDAKPSECLRIMRAWLGTSTFQDQLQQEWIGRVGSVWLEVPIIDAKHVPENRKHFDIVYGALKDNFTPDTNVMTFAQPRFADDLTLHILNAIDLAGFELTRKSDLQKR